MAGILDSINPVATAVDTAGNIAQSQTSDQGTVNQGPAYNQSQIQQTAKELPEVVQKAQQASTSAGNIAKGIEEPQGALIQGQANQGLGSSGNLVDQTAKNYQSATASANRSAVDVENQLKQTQAASSIDPDQYINKMGVGQKTLSALGIALSGVGSGLSGQSNMAMDVLQRNIQRDIAAQQQNFLNQSDILAQRRGVLQTAQEKQQQAILAHNMAVISVNTGAQTALAGMAARSGGAVAPDKAAMLNQTLEIQKVGAQNAIDANHVQTIQSQDIKKVNGVGMAYDAAAHALGKQGIMPAVGAVGRTGIAAPYVAPSPQQQQEQMQSQQNQQQLQNSSAAPYSKKDALDIVNKQFKKSLFQALLDKVSK